MSKILGLAGQAGAGKDYTYQHLVNTHLAIIDNPLVVVRVAFADGVKEDIEDALQTDIEMLWSKPYPDEIRKLLQWWGTELRRAQDEEYWSKKGIAEAKRLAALVHLVVVTDVRFANEVDVIHEAGGRVYEVVAADVVRRERLGGELPPAHASEEIDFDTDGIIWNGETGKPPIIPGDLLGWCGGAETGDST